MNFEPQKFFIGLMDFFSILLPGALLSYLLMDEIGPVVLGDRYAKLAGAEAWAVFLFASYLSGHLIFLLGSWLDELYDWLRTRTLNWQIEHVARGGRMLSWPIRVCVSLVFKRERNLAVNRAGEIKKHALASLQAKDAINTFQWCKALLNAESPESLVVVQRFEADSKFFRSFTVVLLFLLVAWPWQNNWPRVGFPIVLGLLLLALWRFMEQRHKSTNQAYWSVITLTAKDSKISLEKITSKASTPSQAGGVVFRMRGERPEYLLVEDKDDPTQWVLPRGHVEASESHCTTAHRETAVREVYKETGVWARILHDLGDVAWLVDDSVVTTRFFLMQAIGRGIRQERDRWHQWLILPEAIAKANHIETRELLQTAEQRRSRDVGLASDT
jgi:8-oxo-dGTP pyrophosphatase MutT (NUDIX family)